MAWSELTRPTPTRPPLPHDPSTLPPLGPAFEEALERGLSDLGLTVGEGARAAIEAQARLLVAWNRHINLTAIREPERIASLHVVDSLSAVAVLRAALPGRPDLLDLGSGGGYPGLPLAACLPASHCLLLESVAKKARFLAVAGRAVAEALRSAGEEAPEVTAIAARAEDLARRAGQRESWDAVTVRAVGTLAEVAELALPLLRPGGLMVAWKRDLRGSGLAGEVAAAVGLVRVLGGGPVEVVPAGGGLLPGHRLVVVRKRSPTPRRYPRDVADRHRTAGGSGRDG